MGSTTIFSSVFIACLILFNPDLNCQEIPEISESVCPGYNLARNDTFDGASLWGYMNGGADIYLEYGFEILRVAEFSRENESIKLELFKMHDPVSAFGIYSLKTFKCDQDSVLIGIDCLNSYQYQLLHAQYYVQLTNESGTSKARQFMIEIAKSVLDKIESVEISLPAMYLTDSLNIPITDIKMLKGPLGIQNRAFELETYFRNLSEYQVYYVKTLIEGRNITYFEVVFNTPDMKQSFLDNIGMETARILFENSSNILLTLAN